MQTLGCDKLAVVDGMWKIGFRHCAAAVTNKIKGIPLVNYPAVCPRAVHGNSPYCVLHQGSGKREGPHEAINEEMTELLVQGMKKLGDISVEEVDSILRGSPSDKKGSSCPKFDPNEMCRKNKGEGERGYSYSRGYVFVVRGSGLIDAFASIYRAESLGQVFLILVTWMYQRLQDVDESKWSELFLAYDNMCQLDRLLATKDPLPLPAPYNSMWGKISKIIDGLHIANHKNPECKQLYGPDKFKTKFGDDCKQNTMTAEQTFSWLVKYKKQLNSMPKDHQIFLIHRIVKMRNSYITSCIQKGAKIVGPGRRAFNERSD